MRKLLICFAIALAMGAGAVKAAMPEVRIAVLKFGTVNWVMDTIKRQGYDTAAREWCAAAADAIGGGKGGGKDKAANMVVLGGGDVGAAVAAAQAFAKGKGL